MAREQLMVYSYQNHIFREPLMTLVGKKKKTNTIRYPNVLNMVISWQLAYVGFFNFFTFFFPNEHELFSC